VDRQVCLPASPHFRLLLRQTLLEFYLEDVLILCYRMEHAADGTIACQGARDPQMWRWA
jgi:hypothetical protein